MDNLINEFEAECVEVGQHKIPLILTPEKDIKSPFSLFFLFSKGIVSVSGKDRYNFLQRMTTCDVMKLKKGESSCTLFTNLKGQILIDAYILNLGDQILLITNPGEEEKVIKYLSYYCINEDIIFTDKTSEYRVCYLINEEKRDFSLKETGTLVYEKGDEFSVYLFDASVALVDSLRTAGFQPIGLKFFEELRPVYSYARAGIDFSHDNIPNEICLKKCVSYTKGCFLGQETIARIENRGKPKKKLKVILSEEILQAGAIIKAGEHEAGIITTASSLKRAEGYYSLGYVLNSWLAAENPPELIIEDKIVRVID